MSLGQIYVLIGDLERVGHITKQYDDGGRLLCKLTEQGLIAATYRDDSLW